MRITGVYRDIQPVGPLAGSPVVTVQCCTGIGPLPDVGAEVILSEISRVDAKSVYARLAGDEPTLQPKHDLFSLMDSLGLSGRKTVLETSGVHGLGLVRSEFNFASATVYLLPRMAHSGQRLDNLFESWAQLRSDCGDCILMMCETEEDIREAVIDLRKAVEGYGLQVPVYFYLDSPDVVTNKKIAEWFVHSISEFRKLKIDARLGVKITHVSEQFARDKIKPGSSSVLARTRAR